MTLQLHTLSAVLLLAATPLFAATLDRPLTTVEANALGLDAKDGTLMRRGEPAFGDAGEMPQQVAGSTQYASFSAYELRGRTHETYLEESSSGRSCDITSADAFADMNVALANGTQVQVMRIWGFDGDNDDDLTVSFIQRCVPTETSGTVLTTVLGEVSSSGSAGNFTASLFLPATTIDTNSCSYSLRTRFSTVGSGNACGGDDVRLNKVRFQIVQ